MSTGNLAAGKRFYVTKFTSSGTFTLPAGYGSGNPLTVEALVVGGGGGAAGNINQSGSQMFGGGGGGGGVRSDVLSLTADAAVTVGRGGALGLDCSSAGLSSTPNGGNGGFSAVNATAKNLFINPQLQMQRQGANATPPFVMLQGGSNLAFSNTGGAVSGGTYAQSMPTAVLSQPYRLIAGTQYTFSIYCQQGTSGQSAIVKADFYSPTAKTGSAPTSTTTSSTVAIPTWTRISITFTVASGAEIAVFGIRSTGASNPIQLSNPQLEVGSSATTYADGDTNGYAWVGSRDGSETVATGTYVAVPGGGGGAVAGVYATSTTLASAIMIGGYPGATSGGGGSLPTTSLIHVHGGHGGGAGGHATYSKLFYQTSASTQTTYQGILSCRAPFGMGSPAFGESVSATGGAMYEAGNPGPGIEEYGKGGYGALYYNATAPTINTISDSLQLLPGQGGSGPMTTASPSGKELYGNNGADGIVILRYWA